MGTKKTSNTTNQYDAQSMNRYQGWANALQPQLTSLFNNPTGSSFFNFNNQQGQRTASALSGRNYSNALTSFGRSGIGAGLGGGAWMQTQNALGRQASNLGYQGWAGAMNQAQSDRWNAGSMGSSLFSNPLQTGQKNTQQTSGLGTWLPQLIGAGLGIAGGFATGGASGALKGLGGGNSLLGSVGGAGDLYGGSGGNFMQNPTGYFGNNMFGTPGGGASSGGGYDFMNSMGSNPFGLAMGLPKS